MDGPEPGFGLIWGHFDWSVMTDNMFWGFLLTRSGHNNYWVDIPLMFNNDLTHTRASFAMRQWTHRLAGHERIILDSRPLRSEVGVLEPSGLGVSLLPRNMLTSLQVALGQDGFGLPDSLCPAGDPQCLRRLQDRLCHRAPGDECGGGGPARRLCRVRGHAGLHPAAGQRDPLRAHRSRSFQDAAWPRNGTSACPDKRPPYLNTIRRKQPPANSTGCPTRSVA